MGYQVSGASGIRCQVSGIRYQVSGIRYRVSGTGIRTGTGDRIAERRRRALAIERQRRPPTADRRPSTARMQSGRRRISHDRALHRDCEAAGSCRHYAPVAARLRWRSIRPVPRCRSVRALPRTASSTRVEAPRLRRHAVGNQAETIDRASASDHRSRQADEGKVPDVAVANLLERKLRARPGRGKTNGGEQFAWREDRHPRDVVGGTDEVVLRGDDALARRRRESPSARRAR